MNENEKSRRRFLHAAGGAIGAAWFGAHWPAVVAAAEHAHAAAAGRADHEFRLLTPAQARDVEAIAAQIVPGGATPGAREAGVVYFVDAVHTRLFASRAPAFLAGLAAFQAEFAQQHPGGQQFADLDPAGQVAHLKRVESSRFFDDMRLLTIAGLLALPSYGGNAGKLGWQLVGFEDRHVWEPSFGHYDRDYAGFVPYAKEPRS